MQRCAPQHRPHSRGEGEVDHDPHPRGERESTSEDTPSWALRCVDHGRLLLQKSLKSAEHGASVIVMSNGPRDTPDPFHSFALGTLGQVLLTEQPFLEVRIPAEMAAQARSAWERQKDRKLEIVAGESEQRHADRLRAWAFALVGLAVIESGRPQDKFVEVRLPAVAFSRAICAAVDDDAAQDI